MLWYKVWCETRARLAIAAAALAASFALHAGDSPLTIFLLVVIVLGGGSLRQEHALGTARFTLALPVTRARLLAVRAGAGLVEVVLLAALAGALAHSAQVAVRWSACGALVFAVALAVAALVANEVAAWLAAFVLVMSYEAAVSVLDLARYGAVDLYRTMVLGGPVPWASLGRVAAAGAAVLALAHLLTWRRDF